LAESPGGSLSDKVAVVTGGSNGIGAATVRRLAQAGARVAVGYNTGLDRAERLIGELPGAGHMAVHMKLQETQTLRRAAAKVADAYGRADILVNSAGMTRPIPHADLEALDDDTIDGILIANVRGPFATIRAFAPLLRGSGDAVIVNISSLSAVTGVGSNIAYCASKAALDTMTMSLARVLGPEIRVLSVSPGAVPTDFVAGRDRAAVERLAQATPLKRVTEPDDVALAVMSCITHLRSSTGMRILVDGGRHL
jgi:3-oxoacyl-[acyl-carrier protein] reductase